MQLTLPITYTNDWATPYPYISDLYIGGYHAAVRGERAIPTDPDSVTWNADIRHGAIGGNWTAVDEATEFDTFDAAQQWSERTIREHATGVPTGAAATTRTHRLTVTVDFHYEHGQADETDVTDVHAATDVLEQALADLRMDAERDDITGTDETLTMFGCTATLTVETITS